MALKYQALNGTVINKTVTIQGPDISKAGSPMLSLSLHNGVNFYAITSGGGQDYMIYASTSTVSANKFSNHRNYGNYNSVSANSSGDVGLAYVNRSGGTVSIVGKATWILLSSSNEIVVVERNVNFTASPNNYILVLKPSDNNFLVSFTFEPTE